MKSKLSFSASTQSAVFGSRAEYDPKNTVSTAKHGAGNIILTSAKARG